MAEPSSDAPVTAGDLRHQLRTPLNHIIGYSELLIEEIHDGGDLRLLPDLVKIKDSGIALLSMLNTLLADGRVEGTRFHFAAVQEPGSAPPAMAMSAARPAPVPGRVLIVDDDAGNRTLLMRLLQAQGHTVFEAADGVQALEIAAGADLDAILLDIQMPVLDGYGTLQRLKASSDSCHLPVLMVSAHDELDSVVRCIELGADDYLTKPINGTLLRARLGSTLEKKRLHDTELRLYTQLQENYQRLQALEQMREDMTGMLVHDLRTPLTALLTGMQSMPVLGALNADQSEFLSMATMGGETLLRMINDLLDVAKMEDGSLVLERAPLAPAEVAAQAVAQVLPLADDHGLSLICAVPPELPPMDADAEKIRRVLTNLLGNAIKFTPARGRITVSAACGDGGEIEFRVQDTGVGIPSEEFLRIFDKFGQTSVKHAGHRVSTGLGLTFCKLVTELHGGRIWVQSEPGVGTTFLFTVPTVPVPADADTGQHAC